MIASFSALGVNLPSITLIVLHSLSPLLCFKFVCYSGNLIVHLLQGGRGRVSGGHLVLSSFPISLLEPALC